MTICILGRQPKLALAELESLFGAERVCVVADSVARVDLPAEEVARQELGGAIKIARLLAEVPGTEFGRAMDYCRQALPEHLAGLPEEGKVKLGLSVYGLQVNSKNLQKAGLNLKKVVKSTGRSIRVIPNTEPTLNSAQVLHNKLTAELGIELLFIRTKDSILLAQTVHVQDIESYTKRDRGRPRRDAFVGMLPPKLAQTMIHLATQGVVYPSEGSPQALPERHQASGAKALPEVDGLRQKNSIRILDPFCGTGVLLQEAALFGYSVYGTDLSEKMIRYSRDNLNWLKDAYRVEFDWFLEEADAQNHIWRQPINSVVCETYLGQPLSGLPSREKLEEIIHGCNGIARNFLKNIAEQLEPGTRHCVALPAWKVPEGFRHLAVIDELEKIGFSVVEFVHASRQDLIYHRTDQIVARELLVLIKK